MIRVNVIDAHDLGIIRGAEDCTLEELFQLLSKPTAEHKSAQPLVIGAAFAGMRRLKAECISRNVFPLDLDTGGQTFDQVADALADANLAAVLHTTASHTESKPKLRAFVVLSRNVGPEEWPRIQAWARATWPTDPNAVDLPRISYAPVPIEGFQCELIDGKPLDVDALPEVAGAPSAPRAGNPAEDSPRVTELVRLFGPVLPPMGHRHGFYLALIGFCSMQSLPVAECKSLVVQLTTQSNAPHELAKRLGMVDVTYAKHACGEMVSGEAALTEALSHSVGAGAPAIVLQAARIMLGMPSRQERETRRVDPEDDPPPLGPDEKLKGKPTFRIISDLDTHPDWKGVLAWDTFAQRRALLKPAPAAKRLEAQDGDWSDNDTVLVQQWIETKLCYTAPIDQLEKTIENVCKRHYVNLVGSWLDSLPDSDGQAIGQLADTLGLTDEIERKMLRKWLLSAVARAYQPGLFLKSALVMQGEQNAGKSGTLKALFSPKYYVSISGDLSDDKALGERIQGAWIVELEEGAAVSRTEKAALKRALSLQEDVFRPAYGRHKVHQKRTCVFAVTTNTDEILDDETGNVRYYCIRVQDHVDLGRVEGLRDRVWAEVRDAYKAGEAIFLTDRADQLAAADRAREYEITDLLDEPVAQFIVGKPEVTTEDVARHVSIAHDHAVRAGRGGLSQRLGAILRRLGCTKKRSSEQGRGRVWKVPEKYAKQTPANPLFTKVAHA